MPFQSEKQRRYLWANEPEIAREWTDRYGASEGGITRIPFREIPFNLTAGQTMTAMGTPLENQLAELTDSQKKYIDYEKSNLQKGYKTPEHVFETINDPALGKFEKNTLNPFKGPQEPTTKEEYNNYLKSIGVNKKVSSLTNDQYLDQNNLYAESPIIMRDFDYDRTTNQGGIMKAGGYPFMDPTDTNYTPRNTMGNWSELDDLEAQEIDSQRQMELAELVNQGEQYPAKDEYTRFRDTDNFMEWYNKNPELMQTMKDKAGGIWESGIDKGQWALGAAGAAAKLPFTLMAKAANIVNPLSPGSRNYNPDLQNQIDILKASGDFRRLSGDDPSGPYRITSGPLKGKNLVSGFGTNDYGRMLDKRIAYFRNKKSLTEKQTKKMHETIAEKERVEKEKQKSGTNIGGGWTRHDTGGGRATFTGSGGQTHQGYSNTQAGYGKAASEWGSS